MARDDRDVLRSGVSDDSSALLYGGIAAGVLVGAALSTYLWRRRVRALNLLNLSPLERAEQMLANCERKLESIEQSFESLKSDR
jgi:hypothetical protein